MYRESYVFWYNNSWKNIANGEETAFSNGGYKIKVLAINRFDDATSMLPALYIFTTARQFESQCIITIIVPACIGALNKCLCSATLKQYIHSD